MTPRVTTVTSEPESKSTSSTRTMFWRCGWLTNTLMPSFERLTCAANNVHQANEDRARLLDVQESQLVEMAEGLYGPRKPMKVTNEANEALHREAEKNALSWEDWTRELEQQLSLKWEQREALLVRDKDSDLLVALRRHVEVLSRVQKDAKRVLGVRCREGHLRHDGLLSSLREELRTLKRNHQEEILLSVQEALRAALGDLSFRESANVVCGSCPILEKEKQDLREALQEWERSLMEEVQRRQGMERVWEEEHRRLLESEETTRELQESIQTEQNRYEQTLLSEQGRRQDLEQLVQEQFITLTQERTQSGEDPSPWTRDQLERERHANEEVLYQVEEAHTCLETEKLKLWDQEATSWNWTEWG
ncbi:hypothetical protein DYB28_000743 [Aphanomyces astaci]|uniref:Uncharacterized protein n=1 Tax=Aphanomyces astaci TaxID=112090 RepID=A0A9X8E4P4_APHAT|nr:hypothetical protein DYB28_000743 [Aphanomyces astaci]